MPTVKPETSREPPPGFGKGDCLTDRQKAERDVLLFGYGFLMVTSEGEQWLPVEAVAVRTDMVKARGI